MRRAQRPDVWLSPEPAPWPRPAAEPDHGKLTFHEGRFFRDERTIRDPDNVVTQDEQRVLGQRAQEAAVRRLADKDGALAAAVRLGAALKVLKGEG